MAILTGIPSLLPYKAYLSIFNTAITVFLNLSPGVLFVNITKGKEKYENIPPMMLAFNLLTNAIWGCYWHRKGEFSGFFCSYLCGTLATIFCVWYLYYYSQQNAGKFVLFVLLYFALQAGIILFFLSNILDLPIVGILLIAINTMQYVAPAQNLIRVIKEKNHKLIPIVSTLLGSLCSGGWLLFALIIGDINCFIPNGLGCISSVITTIIWYWAYSQRKKGGEEQDEKELIEKGDDEEQ
jgi:hypothetical protein